MPAIVCICREEAIDNSFDSNIEMWPIICKMKGTIGAIVP
jgi:hypothetical protein